LQIFGDLPLGELGARAVHPAHLALLQLQILRRDLGDRGDPGARRSVGLEQKIRRGCGEAEGRYGDDPQRQAARKRYREMAPVVDEQSRRRFVAQEAQALGGGGVSLMAQITGLSCRTIYHGLSDIGNRLSAEPGGVRKAGGGRKKKVLEDPTLLIDLKNLVEPSTRGDPMHPLLWTCRSLRNLVGELANQGHDVCPTVVGNLLRDMGYSLQANSKTREGDQHIECDAQFQYINTQAKTFLAANEPVVSVDTKKKELVGNFKNGGREWRPKSVPKLSRFMTSLIPSCAALFVYNKHCIKLTTLFMDKPLAG
jgi:hypothetical protein